MPFSRYVEIGRVALINYGPEAGTLVVITDVVDQNRVRLRGWAARFLFLCGRARRRRGAAVFVFFAGRACGRAMVARRASLGVQGWTIQCLACVRASKVGVCASRLCYLPCRVRRPISRRRCGQEGRDGTRVWGLLAHSPAGCTGRLDDGL
jgi:hypothetical protein